MRWQRFIFSVLNKTHFLLQMREMCILYTPRYVRHLCLVLLILSFTSVIQAQSLYSKKAFVTFESEAYYDAIEDLKVAYQVEENEAVREEIIRQLALSYYYTHQYEASLFFFDLIIPTTNNSEIKEAYFKLMMITDRPEDAKTVLDDIAATGIPIEELEELRTSFGNAIKWSISPTNYQVFRLQNINSPQSDFSPYIYKENQLLFSSMRPSSEGDLVDSRTGDSFTDIFQAYFYQSDEKDAQDFDFTVPLPLKTKSNTKFHDGVISVDNENKWAYISNCSLNLKSEVSCSIYRAKVDKKGGWGKLELILEADSGQVLGHPAISSDGKTLYFSANLSNSLGGKDLYKSTYNRFYDRWSEPQNLGTGINTAGDEVFPSFDHQGNLYFSSDGHEGMGDLDIFRAPLNGFTFGTPENLQAPLNSSAADFGMTFFEDGKRGFFSSSRVGGQGSDDIYAFSAMPYYYVLQGQVEDSKYGIPLEQVTVELSGNDGTAYTTSTDITGKYNVPQQILKADVAYILKFYTDKYLIRTESFSTVGIAPSYFERYQDGFRYTARLNVKLDPIIRPVVIPNVNYDFGSASLRPEGREALNQLVDLLEENPKIIVELRSHTDHIGEDEDNLTLSIARAKACVDYLTIKGIDSLRLRPVGMGEIEPYTIPAKYRGPFENGTLLTQAYIDSLSEEDNETARALNRRTDFRVVGRLRYVEYKDSQGRTTSKYEIDEVRREEFDFSANLFYTMSSRDNYGKVAKKFNISVEQLRTLNGGLQSVRPFEGLVLKVNLAGDYSEFDQKHYRLTRKDNTLEKVASAVNLSVDQVKKLNPWLSEDDISTGVMIRIE